MLKIPFILHEQNSYPGIVTKIFSKDAKAVFLGFKNAEKFLNKTNTIFTGNPVLLNKNKSMTINLNNELRTLLVFGGSQGSQFLNEKIKIALENHKLDFMNVIWIVGKNNYESLKHFESENIIIYDYCDSMPFLYENVNLVLSRSGAMTISELIKFKKPSILVPFKFSSENHQHFNAKFLHDNFCSKLIEEDNFGNETFISTLRNISQNDRILDSMKPDHEEPIRFQIAEAVYNFVEQKRLNECDMEGSKLILSQMLGVEQSVPMEDLMRHRETKAKNSVTHVDPVLSATQVMNIYSEDDFDEQFEALSAELAEE